MVKSIFFKLGNPFKCQDILVEKQNCEHLSSWPAVVGGWWLVGAAGGHPSPFPTGRQASDGRDSSGQLMVVLVVVNDSS